MCCDRTFSGRTRLKKRDTSGLCLAKAAIIRSNIIYKANPKYSPFYISLSSNLVCRFVLAEQSGLVFVCLVIKDDFDFFCQLLLSHRSHKNFCPNVCICIDVCMCFCTLICTYYARKHQQFNNI